MTRVVIVGNGMAGSRLVEDIRLAEKAGDGPGLDITVFGAESGHAYNRIMLSHVLAGSARAEDIAISSPSWVQRHQVTMRLGVEVLGIDRERREVLAEDGSRTGYDYLVLATGSRARIPQLAGRPTTGP
jgi:assimilatory nitrate reductase electron transfer subunit